MADLSTGPNTGGPNTSGPNTIGGVSGIRPSVLSLAIKDKSGLHSAYMPFLTNGGLFVPTNKSYQLGDEVYLILSLMEDAGKYPVAGRVAWITPAGANNSKVQGIGVHFPADESGQRTKARIEELLGTALSSNRTTHTL
jgi:type IV pilus assembly protein PilZ